MQRVGFAVNVTLDGAPLHCLVASVEGLSIHPLLAVVAAGVVDVFVELVAVVAHLLGGAAAG